MSLSKILKGRSHAGFLRDPNFTGSFVGGPPLLSAKQLQRLIESDEIDEQAEAALKETRERYQTGSKRAGVA